MSRRSGVLGLMTGLLCAACQPQVAPSNDAEAVVLQGPLVRVLRELDESGLIGPPDGKRSVAYELCIPREAEARAIQLGVQVSASPGRSGCTSGQLLAIGETASQNGLEAMVRLAVLKGAGPVSRADFE